MARRILAVMLTLITLIGISGCMNTKKKSTSESIKTEMLAYLEAKYGEEFVPVSLRMKSFAYSYDNLSVYPKNGKKEDTFEVWGTRRDTGIYSMSDGYFGYIIKDEFEAVMSGFVKEIYKDFKLYTTFGKTGVLPDRLNKNTKISEIYNKDEYCSSNTIVFVKQSSTAGINVRESLNKIAKKMVENKLVGSVDIYVTVNSMYEFVDSDTLNNLSLMEMKEYFEGKANSIIVDSNLEISE